ncbi:MAG: hypothetical protein JF606_07035 [Burkholderiales bacterium]|nr:hypothetical protein [Burkholderiales bacterium]
MRSKLAFDGACDFNVSDGKLLTGVRVCEIVRDLPRNTGHSVPAVLETAVLFLWRVKNDGSNQSRVHQKARYKASAKIAAEPSSECRALMGCMEMDGLGSASH